MRTLIAAALTLLLTPTALVLADAPSANLEVRAGTPIQLVTTQELSSKTSQTGDLVQMATKYDIRIDGYLVIPAGTRAVGKIANAQAKGAFGQSGKLLIEPMYIRVGDDTVRLTGRSEGKGSISAGAAVGLALLSAGFTGRSATIPAGSELSAQVLNQVSLPNTELK